MTKFIDGNVTPGFTESGAAADGDVRLQVYLLVTAVPTPANIIHPAILVAAAPRQTIEAVWLNFTCDDGDGVGVGFYLLIGQGAGGALPVPDPLANVTAPLNITQQVIFVPANAEYQRKFVFDQPFKAIQSSGANAFLRVEATSETKT